MARLLDTRTCTYSDATFGPNPVRGATRAGADYVFVASASLERDDPAGALVWQGTGTVNIGNEVRPCGGDFCVAEGGSPTVGRFSGDGGARVTAYNVADLLGAGASHVQWIDASPDGGTLVAAQLVPADSACPPAGGATQAIAVVRLRGF